MVGGLRVAKIMAELSEQQLHDKIISTLKEGEDPKPFVIPWCLPQCTENKDMLSRCEAALKIVQSADPEKTCLFRYRQYIECVENCVQPKIFYHLHSSHNRGKLDGFFDTVWAMRYLFAPLYPLVRVAIAMKRVNSVEGQPIE